MKIKMWGLLSHVLVLVLEWVRNVHLVQRSIPAPSPCNCLHTKGKKTHRVSCTHWEWWRRTDCCYSVTGDV